MYPTYRYLNGSHINLDLVPFGWAKVREIDPYTHNITCQHGEKECYGNRIHACALYLYQLDKSLKFINCTLSYINPVADDVIEKCTKIARISADKLQECQMTKGNSLLVNNGLKSDFHHKYMPAISFNGHFDESIQSQVWHNFSSVILQHFPPETTTTTSTTPDSSDGNIASVSSVSIILVCILLLSDNVF
ncbi:unnamed protein product [Callosobruchus maculatus]|nr:unnamed protein product [Callosobruchus maculatus]